MKLLLCHKCGNIFDLSITEKKCSCGNAVGVYTDYLIAWYPEGTPKTVIPLCIGNGSFREALVKQNIQDKLEPDRFHGARFEAWICPANSNTFKKKELDVDGSTTG